MIVSLGNVPSAEREQMESTTWPNTIWLICENNALVGGASQTNAFVVLRWSGTTSHNVLIADSKSINWLRAESWELTWDACLHESVKSNMISTTNYTIYSAFFIVLKFTFLKTLNLRWDHKQQRSTVLFALGCVSLSFSLTISDTSHQSLRTNQFESIDRHRDGEWNTYAHHKNGIPLFVQRNR